MKKILLGVVLAAIASSAMADEQEADHIVFNIHCTTLRSYLLDDAKGDGTQLSFKDKLYPMSDYKVANKDAMSLVWDNVDGNKVTLSMDETASDARDYKYIAFDYTPDGVKHRCLVENDSE